MSNRPLIAARNRVGNAVRRGNFEEELAARQDLAALNISTVISRVARDQPSLRSEQREALVLQLLSGGAA